MTNETDPGALYWKKIADAFANVSIYDGPQAFQEQFSKLEPVVGNLLAAHWCQSEVCNGGFHQFFGNSTGVLAPEALKGFEDMGLGELAALLRKAMSFFGVEYPRDRIARRNVLPSPPAKGERASWDPFYELDQHFYRWLSEDGFRWDKAADAYSVRADA